jgi:hypothetical protein
MFYQYHFAKKYIGYKPAVIAHTCNPSTQQKDRQFIVKPYVKKKINRLIKKYMHKIKIQVITRID